jgi:hypothetical protein
MDETKSKIAQSKSEATLFRTFVVFVVLLFIFLIADLALSSVNVCQTVGSGYECKLWHLLDLIPTV